MLPHVPIYNHARMIAFRITYKWKQFPRYWPFVRGIHGSPVVSLIKASDAELWCFFDLSLNKRLRRWWFETPSRSLWRQYNDLSLHGICCMCLLPCQDHPVFSCDQAALWMVFSVCPSVCHTFFTMFPSSYHHEILRSYCQWPKWCPCKRSEVKGQCHRGHNPT